MANEHPAATRKTINQLDSARVEAPQIKNRCTMKAMAAAKADKNETRAVKNAKDFLLLSAFYDGGRMITIFFLEPIIGFYRLASSFTESASNSHHR